MALFGLTLASVAQAEPEVFRGETSQGQAVTLRTQPAGIPYEVRFAGYRARCDRGRPILHGPPTGFQGSFTHETRNLLIHAGHDAFGNHTFGRISARRVGGTWSGKMLVIRRSRVGRDPDDGSPLQRTCTARFSFAAHLVREPEPEQKPTRVELSRTSTGNHLFSITGSDAANDIYVAFDRNEGDHIVRAEEGLTFIGDQSLCSVGDTTAFCHLPSARVRIEAGAGDDRIIVGLDFFGAVNVDAGGGADSVGLSPVTTAPMTIDGGGGWDYLNGGAGDDQIRGGTGSDEITGNEGDDFLAGGGGVGPDTLRANAGDDQLHQRDGRGDASSACGSGFDKAVLDSEDPAPSDCESVHEGRQRRDTYAHKKLGSAD